MAIADVISSSVEPVDGIRHSSMRQSTERTSLWKMRREPFQVGESSLTITYERFSDVRIVMSLDVSNFSMTASKRVRGQYHRHVALTASWWIQLRLTFVVKGCVRTCDKKGSSW